GNVALELASVTADHADVVPGAPEVKGLPPGASTELPVTFSPKTEGFISATLTLKATSPDVPVETVRVEGTSLAVPRIAIEPQGDIDFGEVPKGKKREVKAFLLNQGGTPLSIDALTVTDSTGNLKARLPSETLPLSVAPLERVPLTLTLDGITPAELDARVTVASNDPATPSLQVKVFGTVTEPKATVTPVKIDFGNVPVGWVLRRAVEVRNTGFGPLKVKNVTLVSGSSNLFTLQQLPAFPLTLKREQRMAVEVEFRAETQATFNGWVSVETDDPVNPFQEVPLSAVSGSCASSCPIANGTPSCSKGVCEVGTCNANWYDVDKSASNGCECKEPNSDPGSFCADSIYKGVLKDNDKAQVNHLGIIHSEEDVDVIRFFAEDAFSLFSDNFDVKVRLVSNDPNIRMCVYRNPTGSHTSECYWTNEFCPADRYFRKDSSGSGGDDADFIVKVFRAPGSKGSCTTYTVYMSNGI
ncbi:MAG: choice-of-anchor D domain-containing protein, partial [Myxococcales bacterium]